jgi:hypothetical protein
VIAGREMRSLLAQSQRPGGIMGARCARGLVQAEVNVDAVAHAVGHRHGGEDGTVAEAEGGAARHLASDHRMVRGLERGPRCDGELELARPVLGEEGVGLDAGGA